MSPFRTNPSDVKLCFAYCIFKICYFQVDGRVSFHRLVVAAASPLLREAMSQDPNEETIISVPEIPSGVMAAMMDLLYKV